MKLTPLFLILVLTIAAGGCDGFSAKKKHAPASTSGPADAAVSSYVEDVELAKIILRPKRHNLSVKRDPFEPLIKPKEMLDTMPIDQQREEDVLRGLEYLGLVRVGEKNSVLLKTEKGKGVYRINDKVGQLTIAEIHEDHIVFEKNDRNFKLKRGAR